MCITCSITSERTKGLEMQISRTDPFTRMTTIKQYDYLNRLSSISSTPSNSFTYQYKRVNQRTMNQLADGSYWRYGYDALGHMTLAWVAQHLEMGRWGYVSQLLKGKAKSAKSED
jgi:YD repeat-containing protein